jgi:4-amino-4-deoxy-L-arabinose transferase-like glycosyltransferase
MTRLPDAPSLRGRTRAWLAAHPTVGTLVPMLLVVAASRLMALPATIWEQDEAYLAMAARHFDPALNRPQPPWSPAWVGVGRAGQALGLDATRALQLASLAASVASLLPLVAMWRSVLGRRRAPLAALLFLATPVAWLCAGRALSETPATAALLAMCACWCRPRRTDGALAAGSLAGCLAVLIRPQLLPAVALPGILVAFTSRTRRQRAAVALPGLGLALAGAAAMVLAGGGLAPFRESLARHAALHFGQLGDVSYAFSTSGLSRSLLHPAVAAAWAVLALVGVVAVLRAGPGVERALRARSRRFVSTPQPADDAAARSRRSAWVLLATLAGTLLAVYGVASPQHARYFIPILALSAGFVVAGLTVVLGRFGAGVVSVAVIAAFAWQVVPSLALYRSRPSPPVAALRIAAERQRTSGAAIVVDRRLNAFVDYERTFDSPGLRVVYDFDAQLGLGDLDGAEEIVAVSDANHQIGWLPGATMERISWPDDAVRSLSPDRYVDVAVATTSAPAPPPR